MLAGWLKGLREYSGVKGEEAVTHDELPAIKELVSQLRRFHSQQELREQYAIQLATAPSDRKHLDRLLRIAYALRSREIATGAVEIDFADQRVRWDTELKKVLADAHGLAASLRHREVTLLHLLRALLTCPSLGILSDQTASLREAVFEDILSLPAGAPGVTPESSHEAERFGRAIVQQAKERGLPLATPAIALNVFASSYSSILERLGFAPQQFREASERLISPAQ